MCMTTPKRLGACLLEKGAWEVTEHAARVGFPAMRNGHYLDSNWGAHPVNEIGRA
jgi:hypothetical protein